VDNSNPYPTLLGVDWEFYMNVVINLKKCSMTFEKKELRVIVPLDPTEGARYTELVCDDEEDHDIEYIYKMIMRDEYWINPIVDGKIMWEKDNSYNLDSDEELEHC